MIISVKQLFPAGTRPSPGPQTDLYKTIKNMAMYTVLPMHVCRRKGDHSDPDWLLQLELSRRVSAAHHAAEQCLMKANVALRTQGEVLKALTHMVHVLPTASQVCAAFAHVCSSLGEGALGIHGQVARCRGALYNSPKLIRPCESLCCSCIFCFACRSQGDEQQGNTTDANSCRRVTEDSLAECLGKLPDKDKA